MTDIIVTAVLSGAVSSIATIAALKVELRWVRSEVHRAHKRLDQIGARDVA